MIALGDLQKSLGPDQRVSASAGSLSAGSLQPNVVGVWDSLGWQGLSAGAPSPSDKASKFRTWLVSTKDFKNSTDPEFAKSAEGGDSIWLSNPATTGTIQPNNTKMRAERLPMSVGLIRGGLAWMVSDNSTKAPLNVLPTQAEDLAQSVANRTAATGPRVDVLHPSFSAITNPSRIISMQTAALAVGMGNKNQVSARAQSLTAVSHGLLTDVVKGGLKTDLTPLMESSSVNLSTALGTPTPYFSSNDGAPSWNFLRSHYLAYKRVVGSAAGTPRVRLSSTDMAPSNVGIQPRPTREVMLPVIAKLQIVFSLVSHHSHISDRMEAFKTRADPKVNEQHAVPHLAYDPVITLYNPYDVELELAQLRIRVSDPPVGFQFQKHDMLMGTDAWYRQEFGTGEFHGLARFQRLNEANKDARKTFTLFLKNKDATGKPGGNIVLLPGEVKVFSPWVETTWTWGVETAGGYTPRAFFDFENSNNLGNQDFRTKNTRGLEGMPGLDFRAGLQTDHLSYGGNGGTRPAESKYSWEGAAPFGAGWVSLKLDDEVTVNAKPQRCVTDVNLPDFRVDIMSGASTATPTESDILRTFEFRMADVSTELSTTGSASNMITRRFRNRDILQEPSDNKAGGKSPFAIFTMTAKTTKDSRDDSKAWLFNNMATEGAVHDSGKIGNAAQSYDLRLQEIQDFTTFPGVEYDDLNQRGYFGAIANASRGVSIVPMYRIPVTPAASLGDWIGANLVTSSHFPRVNYALGNSFAHPLIPSEEIFANSPMVAGVKMLDHSYLVNAALWDAYYFSTAADQTSSAFSSTRTKERVLTDFFTGVRPMLNSRLTPYLGGKSDGNALAKEYTATGSEISSSRKLAKNMMIQGAFNVNSDSVDAWRAVLSSLRDMSVKGYRNTNHAVSERVAFVRNGLPIAGASDDANPENSVNALGQIRWAGFRTLTDGQIENLAKQIVIGIRARSAEDKAPSLCLADFINRRPGGSSQIHALKGILQTAIDQSGINDSFHNADSLSISSGTLAANRTVGLLNRNALDGNTADGAAPILTQGDLLTGLAPIITARGDTFTIRAYGESRNASGNTVVARAWCEAVVQRVPDYVDPANTPDVAPAGLGTVNKIFGRRFEIISFRWLNSSEV